MLRSFCLNDSGRTNAGKSGESLKEGVDCVMFTCVSLTQCQQIGVAQ